MSGRAWITSNRESVWHACRVGDAGGSLVMACGHRAYGPFHRRIGDDPPAGSTRPVCEACVTAIGGIVLPPRLPRTSHGEVPWPRCDPDADATPTERRLSLAAALETLPPSETEPGSSRLPGSDADDTANAHPWAA